MLSKAQAGELTLSELLYEHREQGHSNNTGGPAQKVDTFVRYPGEEVLGRRSLQRNADFWGARQDQLVGEIEDRVQNGGPVTETAEQEKWKTLWGRSVSSVFSLSLSVGCLVCC